MTALVISASANDDLTILAEEQDSAASPKRRIWFDQGRSEASRKSALTQSVDSPSAIQLEVKPSSGILGSAEEPVTFLEIAEQLERIHHTFRPLLLKSSIQRMFRNAFEARGGQRLALLPELLRVDALSLLEAAISEFRQGGNQDRLIFAGSLLTKMGPQAFLALEDIAERDAPECEYFVSLMAHFKGVDLERRIACLGRLADSQDQEVRSALAEFLPTLSGWGAFVRNLASRLTTETD